MNFDFTEEQTMLKESVERFIQTQYDFDSRRKIADSELGMSNEHWQTFAELGWLSIPFTEEQGGFGGNIVDTMVMMQELGKGLVLEPFSTTVLLFGGMLANSGNKTLIDNLIPSIIEGQCQGAFAGLEAQSRYSLNDVKTTAVMNADGNYVINGQKVLVMNAVHADKLIVSARTSNDQHDQSGVSVFLIDAKQPGISRNLLRLMDAQRVADINFDNVVVKADQLLGEQGKGLELINSVIQQYNVALCAEALGIMEKLNSITVEYAQTRKQFGVAIGSFQALQHRMVDTFMAYEQTKSMLYRTLCDIEDSSTDSATIDKVVHALKVTVARNGKLIGDEAIQIHGGMGLTDELNVGHYVKRLMMINVTFGDGDYHQQQFNRLNYLTD